MMRCSDMQAVNTDYRRPLPQGITFCLRCGEKEEPVFSTGGKWLHPIFDMERFLSENPCMDGILRVHDSAVGKAAAVLLVYNGIRYIHADLASSLAVKFIESLNLTVPEEKKVIFSYDRLVERFGCATEGELENLDDIELMYKLIKRRA